MAVVDFALSVLTLAASGGSCYLGIGFEEVFDITANEFEVTVGKHLGGMTLDCQKEIEHGRSNSCGFQVLEAVDVYERFF